MRRLLLAAACLVAVVPAADASQTRGFAFGRTGGNIRPYTVAIANDGTVTVRGAADVGRLRLTRLQLANLNRVAIVTRFTQLPARTSCKGTLPDVAGTFIRVGAYTVRVHGGCLARYQRMWKALGAAVELTN